MSARVCGCAYVHEHVRVQLFGSLRVRGERPSACQGGGPMSDCLFKFL